MLLEDIFEDAWAYQEIIAKGRQKGFHEGELLAWRGAVLDIVQDRFPSLVTFVSNHIKNIDETTLLRRLNVKLSGAQTVQEAEQTFRSLVKELS